MTKRVISMILAILVIWTPFLPNKSYAAKADEQKYITINSDGSENEFLVLEKNGKLFLNTKDISKITRYKLLEDVEKEIKFKLGVKYIFIKKDEPKFEVHFKNKAHSYDFSDQIISDNKVYIPIAEILPWLNTNASVKDGVLVLNSDPYSMWELIEYNSERGDIYRIMDGMDTNSGWTVAGLSALSVMHSFFGMKWQRFVPMKVADSKYDKRNTLYDVNNYKACLFDMAGDDTLYTERVGKVLKQAKSYGKVAETVGEMFSLDDAKRDDVSAFLLSLREGTDYYDITKDQDIDLYDIWSDFDGAWKDATDIAGGVAKGAGTASKIVETAKAIEVAQNASPDYYRAVVYLAENTPEDNHILKKTAKDTQESLESVLGLAIAESMTKGQDLISEGLEKGIGGSFSAVVSVVKAALNIVWPSFVKAAEGTDKLGVYQDIMITSSDYVDKIMNKNEITVVDINNSRALLGVSYRSAEEGMEITDKLLRTIGKKNQLDKKINLVKDEMAKVALSADSALNDSMEGKEEFQKSLEKLLAKIKVSDSKSKDTAYQTVSLRSPGLRAYVSGHYFWANDGWRALYYSDSANGTGKKLTDINMPQGGYNSIAANSNKVFVSSGDKILEINIADGSKAVHDGQQDGAFICGHYKDRIYYGTWNEQMHQMDYYVYDLKKKQTSSIEEEGYPDWNSSYGKYMLGSSGGTEGYNVPILIRDLESNETKQIAVGYGSIVNGDGVYYFKLSADASEGGSDWTVTGYELRKCNYDGSSDKLLKKIDAPYHYECLYPDAFYYYDNDARNWETNECDMTAYDLKSGKEKTFWYSPGVE